MLGRHVKGWAGTLQLRSFVNICKQLKVLFVCFFFCKRCLVVFTNKNRGRAFLCYMYIYIYIYIYILIYLCIYIYIYVYIKYQLFCTHINIYKYIPPRKLMSPRKLMIGILASFWCGPVFTGYMCFLGSVYVYTVWVSYLKIMFVWKKWVTCRFHVHLPGCKLINKKWVVVSNIFYVHPYLGKIPILTNIFQRGWNHQLDNKWYIPIIDDWKSYWPSRTPLVFQSEKAGLHMYMTYMFFHG